MRHQARLENNAVASSRFLRNVGAENSREHQISHRSCRSLRTICGWIGHSSQGFFLSLTSPTQRNMVRHPSDEDLARSTGPCPFPHPHPHTRSWHQHKNPKSPSRLWKLQAVLRLANGHCTAKTHVGLELNKGSLDPFSLRG